MTIRNIWNVDGPRWRVVVFIFLGTVTAGNSESLTCKAVLKNGKPIVICGLQPDGVIFLLHTRNSDQKTTGPVYHCIWTRSQPDHCFGLDGFSSFTNENDAEYVAFEVPLDFVHGQFFCLASEGRSTQSCSFDIRDINVLPTSTSTNCNNTCSSSTAAPSPSDNPTHQSDNLKNIVIVAVTAFIAIPLVIAALLFKRRKQKIQRQQQSPPNEELALMDLDGRKK